MVQSIELLLDDESDARLREQWAALAAADLPSLATHTGETNRPHVTVAVAEEGLDRAGGAVGAVARGWDLAGRGLDLTVGAVVLFGGHRRRWVLARQVVPSRPLLTLHAAVHQAARSVAQVDEQTVPDAWTPHVSLARRIPADRLPEALDVLDPAPIACRVVGMRLWDSVAKSVTQL